MQPATQHHLPWWQRYPDDYYRSSNLTETFPWRVNAIKQTVAIDKLTRLSLASIITLATLPSLLNQKKTERELAYMEFYKALATRANPKQTFAEPPKHIEVKPLNAPLISYRPKGVNAQLLGFESTYQAVNPAMREVYQGYTRNHRSVAHYWCHGDKPRPTMIWTHGVVMDPFWINSQMFSLKWFYKNGYDILLYTLPFHGYRKERSDFFNGMGFFTHGMPHVNEAMLQAVYDLRCWVSWLKEQGAPAVGAGGMSLGGYITTLAASSEPRLAFAIPNVPVVMPADMLMEWQPTGVVFKQLMKQQNISMTELRHMLAIHSPLTWQPAIDTDNILIVGGSGDRFASPRYVKALHEHWQGSHIHWFPGNHLLHLRQDEYLKRMREFMDQRVGKT